MKNNSFNSISVLVDNDSWILPYAQQLIDELSVNYECSLVRSSSEIPIGDICFFLGCIKIVNVEVLSRNKFNLVVHESALPLGKGYSPMSWQILEGRKEIPICLIEATDAVDAGDIWLTDTIKLNGCELHDEWRELQGMASIKLAREFVESFDRLTSIKQKGESHFYPKRTSQDSELSLEKSLLEQFNLLRIVSNTQYPAYFIKNGIKYKIEISREQ